MLIKKIIRDYYLSFISGLTLIFCFPTFDLFFLAWIAFSPFLISIYSKEKRSSFLNGIIFGITYFFGTLYWIYYSVNHYGGVPFFISIAIVFLLCLYLSIYTGIFSLLFSFTIKNTSFPAMLIAPVYWVVLEFLRTYIFTGFPWSIIGYSQYKFLTLIQIADITGVYGISFIVLAVNGAIADIFITKNRLKIKPLFPLYPVISGAIILLLLLATTFIYGWFRLNEKVKGKEIVISIIQGNIEQDKKWEPVYQESVLNTYFELSKKALSHNPSLIVWPETALPFIFGKEDELSTELIEFQRGLNSKLLLGSILIKERNNEKYILSNSALLLDENGKISFVYDKIHLVPFGEYIPLKKFLFFIDRLVYGIGDYISGDSYIKAHTSIGNFATVICYEIIFPGMIRKFFKDGGDFLVNITNDAWFGRTTGPYQHFSMAVFRAIENRKPVIRSANTGISGFIDSYGNILSQTELFKRCYLTEKIITVDRISFYSKYGDLFVYLCIIITIIILINFLL